MLESLCVYLFIGIVFAIIETVKYRKALGVIRDSAMEEVTERGEEKMVMEFHPSLAEELIIGFRVAAAWPTYIAEWVFNLFMHSSETE